MIVKRIGTVFALVASLSAVSSIADEVRPGVYRTPDGRFENLPDYAFAPNYLEYEGYRIHYVDVGPRDADPVLLMHGEPSWSYLYRHMIPPLVAAGHRVIAPDLIGFGKSDKPAKRTDHSYQFHVDSFMHFVTELELNNITLFCQDWGSLIGLRLVTGAPERFARVVAGNAGLPAGAGEDGIVIGTQWTEPDPNAALNFDEGFMGWLKYSQTVPDFDSGAIVQTATVRELTPGEMDAYRAPFPDENYAAGARVMPTLVASQQATNREAWKVLEAFDKPFLTTFSDGDPISKGGELMFQNRVPGAKGQPHTTIKNAGHFLQEDASEQLASLINAFIAANPVAEKTAGLMADDIPIAHTPEGYWKTMPPPILEGCDEPLVDGAPDMRGLWKVVDAKANGNPTKMMLGSVQRIEQCGNRVVICGGGVTHDMRCDGTYENGVNDIGEPSSNAREISVAASFEKGVHILRPKGMSLTVEREMDGDMMIWRYGPELVLRLERIE